MIKNLLLGAALIVSTISISQKDVAVTLNTPAAGSTVQSNAPISVEFTVSNVGTDPIVATDSVYFAFGFNNNGSFTNFFGQSIFIAPRTSPTVNTGESWTFTNDFPQEIGDLFSGSDGNLEGDVQFCIAIYLYEGTSTTPLTDADPTNDISCNTFTLVTDYASLEEADEQNINVYPNPASTSVTIENANDGQSLQIINLSGKTVINQTLTATSNKVDVNALTSGLYIYNIVEGNKIVKTSKLAIK